MHGSLQVGSRGMVVDCLIQYLIVLEKYINFEKQKGL